MNDQTLCKQYPLVSIVVPVRNGVNHIEKLLNALMSQDYPKSFTEIIIVDNSSMDHSREMARKYPVILEMEDDKVSSYAARNKGIRIAQGEIIAFTDADCIPKKNWLSEGVRALSEGHADMAGGKISFILSDSPSAAEVVDSVTFMQNEQNVQNKQTAVTANLFVRKVLFERIGLFEEAKSGEDFRWTKEAVQKGFSLIYADQAVIFHPARTLGELLEKGRRVGRGIVDNFFANQSWSVKMYVWVRHLIPIPSKNVLKFLLTDKSNKAFSARFFAVWTVSYLLQIHQLIGMILSIFKSRVK